TSGYSRGSAENGRSPVLAWRRLKGRRKLEPPQVARCSEKRGRGDVGRRSSRYRGWRRAIRTIASGKCERQSQFAKSLRSLGPIIRQAIQCVPKTRLAVMFSLVIDVPREINVLGERS